MDLFGDAAEVRRSAHAPLADRMRPLDLEGFAGQPQLVAPGAALRRAIEEDRVTSAIFHGPPGTGKTTLARIVATISQSAFDELSAVNAGKADVQKVIGRAEERLGAHGQRTLLFIDEIHRFNKAQQDALLPVVESGLITLIGATTENPYHAVIGALLSRCRLYEFRALDDDSLRPLLERALAELGSPGADEDVIGAIARASGGDARNALQTLQVAHDHAVSRDAGEMTVEDVAEASRRLPVLYDRDGDRHYDTVSAFIKSVRGSDPDAALFYLASMIAGGEDPVFIARRLVILASEDIGNADPQALPLATACAAAVQLVGLPEARYAMAQTTAYLALAPKSNASALAIGRALDAVAEQGNLPAPRPLRDASYRGAASLGNGTGYRYPHDFEDGWVDQQYLPDRLAGSRFYEPTGRGAEERLGERLDELHRRHAERPRAHEDDRRDR